MLEDQIWKQDPGQLPGAFNTTQISIYLGSPSENPGNTGTVVDLEMRFQATGGNKL